MSYFSQLTFADSAMNDAFSRFRVSTPEHLFDSKMTYGLDPLQFEAGATGTGISPTWSSNTRMASLSCTAGSGTSYLQSFKYLPYQAGRSQIIRMTGVMGTAVAGAVKDTGYFDLANGIFYRQNGTSGMQWVKRSSTSGSVVDSPVNQTAWNIDTFDGSNSATNPSGITLDPTKDHIIIIDLQFLSMGRVRCGFDFNGIIYWAHQFTAANILAVPYMQTATLPIQSLITCTSTATTATLLHKCVAVASEGGNIEPFGFDFATPSVAVTVASGARTHGISIRKKTTFNGLTNRKHTRTEAFQILATGNNPILWELCFGVTFSVAPTYADINATYSAMEYGSGGTYSSLSNGIVIDSGYVSASNQQSGTIDQEIGHQFSLGLDRSGAVRSLGTLSLLLTGIGGPSACNVMMSYSET